MTGRVRGVVVVVTGPDGSGKTEVADGLVDKVLTPPVLHLHHRPALLPSRTRHAGPVTEPHAQIPYPTWLSALKLIYLWADFVAGWWLRVRPVVGRGGSVVLERGWWDLAVDPRRYRLTPLGGMVRLLGTLLPRPDVTLVLTADPSILLSRKQELPAHELQRQVAAWQALAAGPMRAVEIDAARSVQEVFAAAVAALPRR